MTVDSAFSRKMTVLSVVAMVSVVFIQSTAYLTMANPSQWNVFVETLVTRSFTRWAVPFFFLVSGFWLGRGRFIGGDACYCSLLKNKAQTLLIPYLCWCVLGFLVALPLIVGNNILGHKGLWERTILAIPGIWPKVDAFFGITFVGPKSNGPLWYVRSLMLLFLLAPIWRYLMRISFGKWVLAAFAILNLLVFNLSIPFLKLAEFGMSWFVIGLLCAQFPVESWRVPTWSVWSAFFAYASLSVMKALQSAGCVANLVSQGLLDYTLIPVFGIIFFWGVYDLIHRLVNVAIPWPVRQAFFIYCLHEIICGYLLATSKFVLGKTDVVTCACVFVVPWLSFMLCAFCAWGVHRLSPQLYNFICGGRSK